MFWASSTRFLSHLFKYQRNSVSFRSTRIPLASVSASLSNNENENHQHQAPAAPAPADAHNFCLETKCWRLISETKNHISSSVTWEFFYLNLTKLPCLGCWKSFWQEDFAHRTQKLSCSLCLYEMLTVSSDQKLHGRQSSRSFSMNAGNQGRLAPWRQQAAHCQRPECPQVILKLLVWTHG